MNTLMPHLTLSDTAAALEFYKKAFGAEEKLRMPAPDGKRIMHASMMIGNSIIMLADEFPEYGGCKSPKTLGGTAVTIHINSPDVDKTVAAAVAAGARVTMPVADMFWGDRYGKLVDPFGHEWSVSTPKKQMTPEEMKAAGAEAFKRADKKMQGQQQQ